MPELITGIGLITTVLAAFIGLAQRDIKRVVAYSTLNSLGLMFVALGVGRRRRGDALPVHARLLQGAALPRLPAPSSTRRRSRRSTSSAASGTRCRSRRRRSSSARWRWPGSSRSPASGRRTRSSSASTTAHLNDFVLDRRVHHAADHGALHDARRHADVLRQAEGPARATITRTSRRRR